MIDRDLGSGHVEVGGIPGPQVRGIGGTVNWIRFLLRSGPPAERSTGKAGGVPRISSWTCAKRDRKTLFALLILGARRSPLIAIH